MPVPRPSYPMYPAGWFEAEARASGVPAEMARSLGSWMARVMDKQAIDERLNYQWINDNMGSSGGRAATVVVATSDSTDAEKAGADIVCDGVSDHIEVQEAVDIAEATTHGGQVLMLSGSYNFTTAVVIPAFVTVRGMGVSTGVYGNVGVFDALFSVDTTAYGAAIMDMYLATDNSGRIAILQGGNAESTLISGVTVGQGLVYLAYRTRIVGCNLAEAFFTADSSLLVDCQIIANNSTGQNCAVLFGNCSLNRMVGCNVFAQGDPAVIFGSTSEDNAVTGCTLMSNASADNTQETVALRGTRDSFTDNVVRSNGVAGLSEPQYGVDVEATATDCRVKFNDLRSTGWGTGAYNDAGTGTLASDNDV